MNNELELIDKQKLSNKEIVIDLFSGKKKETELTTFQAEYLEQIRSAYSMLIKVKSRKYIVGALHKHFGISQGKAYRIIREAAEIFADVGKVDKEIYRHMAIEMAKKAFRMAEKKKNTKDMINAINALSKAVGLDRDDADLPDFEKLNPSLIINVLPEGMEEQIMSLLSHGAVNLNNIPAESIPYEEIENKPGGAD
jgi:hypothetical protein